MNVEDETPEDVALVAPNAFNASAPRTNRLVDALRASREGRDVPPTIAGGRTSAGRAATAALAGLGAASSASAPGGTGRRRSLTMSPEKAAVLTVTLLICALLAAALFGAEPVAPSDARAVVGAGVASPGAPPPARRAEDVDSLTYDDLRGGRFRPAPPKPRPADVPTPPPPPTTYVVRSGDTLARIAKRELGSERHVGAIARLNPGLVANKLRVGQTLNLPAKEEKAAKAKDAAATPTKPGATKAATPTAERKTAGGATKKPSKGSGKSGAVKPRTV